MKHHLLLFMASFALLSSAACSEQSDSPGKENGSNPEEKQESILGEWIFQKNELYQGETLVDSFTATEPSDKMVVIFNEDGTYRYYDYPPSEYYDGTYTYNQTTKALSMSSDAVASESSTSQCEAKITDSSMKWTYPTDTDGYKLIEYYIRK